MRIVLILFSFLLFNANFSQEKYWVYLTDKEGVEFNPHTYFDQKAINRRIKNNVPLNHITDRPLRTDYQKKITSIAESICGDTRWFNAIACKLTPQQLIEIRKLTFVKEVAAMSTSTVFADGNDYKELHKGEYDLLEGQIASMHGKQFTKNGLTGKGIRICIIDAGFPNVNTSSIYKHIRDNNRILKTWDFKKNKPDIYRYSSHGSTVLSCIAGKRNEIFIGLAIDSEFLLARTERIMYEGDSEEEDWLMAIEWADKNGADIVNSSLGYTSARHFIEDMNGETCIISKAGNLAARKGMLVINAAGNDGDGNWKYIGAPADADSVLSVGGINPWTGLHTAFSSYGPTADHRLKPNLSAFGHVMGYSPGVGVHETQGTSFSSPLVAGFAACAWQSDTSLTNMQLFKKLEESANLHPYFDYAHGYGIPQATYFTEALGEMEEMETFTIDESESLIQILIKDDYFTIEDKIVFDYFPYPFKKLYLIPWLHLQDSYSTLDSNIKKSGAGYFYYHIENDAGYLDEYFVLSVYEKSILRIRKSENIGKTYRFHYKGTSKTITIE
ncbi:MAG: S8 family serine peptidase [Flavobacteriales bacterium]|nr:S8 family serine peptidase [Flavobacteriales bacterium]